uniref:Transmembrane protein 107 n=1 Tax=Rhizochromulina marina TaxID=1034831 RepID=A0A7S2WNI1_9STRA|mmetsp:Transcript_28609/g.83715  ORF Transcript_28609/g.83715 Transcript_28609/m.83715 type:complete len:139 (+) Transcript_28609:58-474(+)|eukprot:CAMPEP_0118963892 /NCGR_PEP_ID=MMETSP1173-20130426/1720_1 /TAXON_ID=1034831 /ORGANISM="Rhizochromulina marina cf, Strain CCMP1243" /LENGTH=138 /DNA_ID=CAMNT_0006912301 /DNA_START=60 /DNA_END=476 /DNA_ORIENTATION=-
MLRNQLIAARFVLTLGHLVSLFMVLFSMDRHIYAGFPEQPTGPEMSQARKNLKAAVTLAGCCFFFDLSGIFYHSLFMNQVNCIQIFLHFMGGVLVSVFIYQSWNYLYMWPLVMLFNIPSLFIEISVLFAYYVLKIVVL